MSLSERSTESSGLVSISGCGELVCFRERGMNRDRETRANDSENHARTHLLVAGQGREKIARVEAEADAIADPARATPALVGAGLRDPRVA
jgi:hypothetical protein